MENNRYSIVLRNAGKQKLLVVKAIRELTGKSLKESSEIVQNAPCVVVSGLPQQRATVIKQSFDMTDCGAQFDIVPDEEVQSQPQTATPSATAPADAFESHYDKGKRGCMLTLLLPLALISLAVAIVII